MRVYIITYPDDPCGLDPVDEIAAEGSLVSLMRCMVDEERITYGLDDFKEEHGREPETDADAAEVIENEGYKVDLMQVYERSK